MHHANYTGAQRTSIIDAQLIDTFLPIGYLIARPLLFNQSYFAHSLHAATTV
jgi:hypothetical protein